MELLAPAGGYEAVLAAVANGASAVYLGQQKFNARQNAENFDRETLRQAVDYCHIRGVKVYQTLNTVVYDEELDDLQDTLRTACELGIDALIVQDFGVLRLAQQACPQMRLHGSTQMSVHTPKGAELLRSMGLKRVVLARELSLAEIQAITEQVDIEVEVFAHGALCMSVSGQCYMSAMIGGRSGNRGSCAGTCRLPFSATGKPNYDLSLKDLCSAAQVHQLEAIGVTSLKIEGRMKRPEYVAAATQAYTARLHDETPDLERLRAVFSRSGFTDGYLTGKRNADMFGIREKEDVVAATDQIFAELQGTYRKERPTIPVSMHLTLRLNEPSALTISDEDGHAVTVSGEPAQQALNKPTTQEFAQESLAKLGGTPYYLTTFTSDLAENGMLPKSKLNALRREAVEALSIQRAQRPAIVFEPIVLPVRNRRQPHRPTLRARFAAFEQIPFSRISELEYLYLPVDEILRHQEELKPLREKIIVEPDRALFGTENRLLEQLDQLQQAGFAQLAVSNPAHLQIARERRLRPFGTSFLNITNSLSAEQYAALGLTDTILSAELTVGRLHAVAPQPPMTLGVLAYGYLPLMLVRNCPVQRHRSCVECGGHSTLTDRLGNRFRVVCREHRYSEVLNCKVLNLSDKQRDFQQMDFLTLYFTVETQAECERVLDAYEQERKAEGNFTRGLYYRGTL